MRWIWIPAALLMASCQAKPTPAPVPPDEMMCRIPGEGVRAPMPEMSAYGSAGSKLSFQQEAGLNLTRCLKTKAWDFRHLEGSLTEIERAVSSACQDDVDDWRLAEMLLRTDNVATDTKSAEHVSNLLARSPGYIGQVQACLKGGSRPTG